MNNSDSQKCFRQKHLPLQHATPVKDLLFLTRMDYLCKAGCALYYFQCKIDHVLIFVKKATLKFLAAKLSRAVADTALNRARGH